MLKLITIIVIALSFTFIANARPVTGLSTISKSDSAVSVEKKKKKKKKKKNSYNMESASIL